MTAASDAMDDIEMIRQSARGLADRRDLGRIRKLRYGPTGFDRQVWREICDQGWTALRTPEADGGVGLGARAYCALAQELGAALTPEPLIGAVLAAACLSGEALTQQLVGERLYLAAWQDERDAAGPAGGIRLVDGKLHGAKHHIPMAPGADGFVVIEAGQAWLVQAHAPGVRVESTGAQDGGQLGVLLLDGAAGEPLRADPAPALAEACLATSAYLLGVIDAALDLTLDYLKARVQFGKPIGTFQALQHRAVDLRLQAELTRASVDDAAARWDAAPGQAESLMAISRAKVRASGAAMLVTRQAIQLHGGIGYTDEHDIGLYLRKAMVVAPQFGSPSLHRRRFAALSRALEARAA